MRGLVITSILFLILVCIIILNAFFVQKSIENMKKNINSLNYVPCKENEDIIDAFIKEWEKTSIWLSFSVSYSDIQDMTDMIDALKAANQTQNLNQFQIHVELLLNAIDEIGRLENLSIKNIL